MNVPLSVINGKSPMKTVWLLISPVSWFMNSAVTKSGAEDVKSRSLPSSTVFFGGSNRWSRNERLIVCEKSSIGEISSKISSRPDLVETSDRPSAFAFSTRACHRSLPISQSNDSAWRASRSGASRGSPILAKEMRLVREGLTADLLLALREAAKSGPSEGSRTRSHMRAQRHTRLGGGGQEAAQRSSLPDGATAVKPGAAAVRCPLRMSSWPHVPGAFGSAFGTRRACLTGETQSSEHADFPRDVRD